MASETVTARFCAAMLDAARSDLPPGPSRAARRTLLNVIGTAVSASGSDAAAVLLAAAGDEGAPDMGGRYVRTSEDSGGAGGHSGVVPGRDGLVHPYWAALVTGTAAHLDDFDDTHLATVIHPGASVLATVLALAPGLEVSGAAFLGAFAAGCESQLRIGNAISPAHYDRGWHITGTCGVFGAALAAAALLGLDAEAAARALSLAAVMTAGHREAFGSMTKPLHAGKAAANGILAARLASAGLAGPGDPLGPGGVLETLAGGPGGVTRSALEAGWELELNTFKTYPCGVVAHPAMDAALDAYPLLGDSPSITSVSVTCNPLVLELMGLVHPSSGLQARFSARHGIAAGLRYGRAGLGEFSDEAATDPEMARLRDLISLDPDPACARDAAVLRVATRSGSPVEVRAEHTRGSVARPLTDSELLARSPTWSLRFSARLPLTGSGMLWTHCPARPTSRACWRCSARSPRPAGSSRPLRLPGMPRGRPHRRRRPPPRPRPRPPRRPPPPLPRRSLPRRPLPRRPRPRRTARPRRTPSWRWHSRRPRSPMKWSWPTRLRRRR